MRTTKLAEIQIIGHKQDKLPIIKQLQELGALHVAQAKTKEKAFIADSVQKDVNKCSKQLLQLAYIKEQSHVEFSYELSHLSEFSEVQSEAKVFIEKYLPYAQKQSAKEADLRKELSLINAQINLLERLPFTIKAAPEGKTHRLFVGRSPFNFAKIKEEVSCHIAHNKTEKYYYYTVTLEEKDVESLHSFMQDSPLKKIDVSFLDNDSKEVEQFLRGKKILIEKNIALHIKETKQSFELEKIKLPFLVTSLENYREQQNITNKFLTSKNFFIISGFLEYDKVDALKEAVPHASIRMKEAGEEAPTKLKEKGLNKHFQLITELFGLPKYGSVDPTPIVAFFYPFFFGFMLSDVGYGVLLLGSIIGLRLLFGKSIQSIYVIFALSGISSIIFGLLFGSFFGNLIYIQPLLTDSFSASFNILKASLIIGLVHLNIAVALNIYQMKNKGMSLLKILAQGTHFILLELAALFAVLSWYYIAAGTGLLLIFLLVKQKGGFGIMDITGYFGTLFSYARLLALSLATAGVALAINLIAEKALALGRIGVVLWLIVLIGGHLFNFALNMLGCSIHAARLHYVEFFSLFFEGDGKKFTPFKLKKTYGGI